MSASSCNSDVQGVVIGTRKAGTTWLYENFRADPFFRISDKVKESGYFARPGRYTKDQYHDLLPPGEGMAVEVDASVCYSPDGPTLLQQYNPDLRLVLILRDPAEYMVSRYIHSRRKGELPNQTLSVAFSSAEWFRGELDYAAILARFQPAIDRNNLLILSYELLQSDPQSFYSLVAGFLSNGRHIAFSPSTERVNQARTSKLALLSALLSNAAIFARELGLHRLVNAAKRIGFHRKMESLVHEDDKLLALEEARSLLVSAMPETQSTYEALK
ncbi:sulfotransferase domain-containing protein [Myxococcota bacterium]|nr:sulfotransferase domain-containing protein [Myxococcota bacterium]